MLPLGTVGKALLDDMLAIVLAMTLILTWR
jgi:hypothetical protein